MKKIFLAFGLSLLLSTASFAAMDPANVETRVQSDLDNTLSRVLAKDTYLVHVTSTVDTITEKKLLEGETITQVQPRNDIVVPPLPGFQPAPVTEAPSNPGQSRQVFKTVDKDVLKSVAVQVTYSDALPAEQVAQAKDLVSKYLSMNFASKGQASFSAIKMLAPALTPRAGTFDSNALLAWAPWVLLMLLGIAAFWAFSVIRKNAAKPVMTYPTVMGTEEEEANYRTSRIPPQPPARPGPLALPSGTATQRGNFPALPATRDFVDRRAELLENFLKSADTFRLYFAKLPEAAQVELYAALRGPAFDSLLETLELEIPAGGETSHPPTEDQMLFYLKNFYEFLQTNSWQNEQFFGFLGQLSRDQLLALIKQENPLVGALMLKYMKSEQSASILGALTSPERQQILMQFTRIQGISTQELVSIEEAVREHVVRLPKFLLGYATEDLSFWTKILSQSEQQDAILEDLEKSHPELYPSLAKFRFKLEDLPSLPQPLIAKVLAEVDNEELALAMANCSRDVVAFVLAELPANRRALLSNQIAMTNGMPHEQLTRAKSSLTMRFREVMA